MESAETSTIVLMRPAHPNAASGFKTSTDESSYLNEMPLRIDGTNNYSHYSHQSVQQES